MLLSSCFSLRRVCRSSTDTWRGSLARGNSNFPAANPAEGDPTPVDVTFGDVSMAMFRIRSGIHRTQVHHSTKMSRLVGSEIHFKSEFSHPTGSFKERGARNALLQLGTLEHGRARCILLCRIHPSRRCRRSETRRDCCLSRKPRTRARVPRAASRHQGHSGTMRARGRARRGLRPRTFAPSVAGHAANSAHHEDPELQRPRRDSTYPWRAHRRCVVSLVRACVLLLRRQGRSASPTCARRPLLPAPAAEAREHGLEVGAREGMAYVHGFDDPHGERGPAAIAAPPAPALPLPLPLPPAVIAGAGTMGMEILEQARRAVGDGER